MSRSNQIEQGSRRAAATAEVVVASVATLARSAARVDRLDARSFRIVIVDEAHHATAPTYQRILNRLRDAQQCENRDLLIVGFTATAQRADGKALGTVFQEIVDVRTLPELIERGILSDMRAYRLVSSVDLKRIRTVAGDFHQRDLAAAVNTAVRNHTVVEGYNRLAAGRRALVFCVDVKHAQTLAHEMNASGVATAVVHGGMSRKDRENTIRDFRSGRYSALTNCMVLTEGFDVPEVSCVIQARPTLSQSLYAQMIGRGSRCARNKRDCVVLDVVDNWSRHSSVVTMASLLGLPARLDLEGVPTASVRSRLAHARAALEYDGRLLDRFSDLDLLAFPVPLWNGGNVRDGWQSSTPDVYQFNLGGICRERLIIWFRNGGWHVTCARTSVREEPFHCVHPHRLILAWERKPDCDELFHQMFCSRVDAQQAAERWILDFHAEKRDYETTVASHRREHPPSESGARCIEAWREFEAHFRKEHRRYLDARPCTKSHLVLRRHAKRYVKLRDTFYLLIKEESLPTRLIGAVAVQQWGCYVCVARPGPSVDVDKLLTISKYLERDLKRRDAWNLSEPMSNRVEHILGGRGWEVLPMDIIRTMDGT